VRVQGQGPLAGLGTIEPLVANRQNDPCQNEQTGVLNNFALPAGLGTLNVLFARTQNTCPNPSAGCPEGSGSFANAGVLDVTLNAPGVGPIRAEVLTSQASATCVGGNPALAGRSTVLAVTVAGQRIEPVPQNFSLAIPGVGTLFLNQQTRGPNEITQRALFLDTAVLDVVIAEAIADFRGNPCRQEPPQQRFPGFMTGGGYVAEPGTQQDHNGEGNVDPGTRAQHAFSIDCFFPTASDEGKKDNLVAQFHDDDAKEHGSFQLDTLIDAACTKETNNSPNPPRSAFDTVRGRGVGFCKSGNDRFPAIIEFRFTDEGEPGRDVDQADMRVSSPVAAAPVFCNYTARGRLDGGNHQAHQRPGDRPDRRA
jgi:hypothetical protein